MHSAASIRTTPAALGLALACVLACVLACAGPARADQAMAQRKAREKQCIADCPKPTLTWQNGETREQWKKRVVQEAAYDACFIRCARAYVQDGPQYTGRIGHYLTYHR